MNDILSANRHIEGLTDEERAERARLAVKNFRAMQRSLTGFARALTGRKDVRVELDSGSPRTDGSRIFFRPPLAMGTPAKHDRTLCEKRGENARLLCAACRVREEVMVVIYHEISHIAFDSFAPTLEQHKTALTQRAIEEWGTQYAQQIKARIEALPEWVRNDYKSMSGAISPFLPPLVNALEDSRVNASMFRARPGIKVMMKAHVYGLLNDGVEQADGTIIEWNQQPLNAQVMVGCFVIGAGYDVQPNWFHPEVTEALADTDLIELCHKAGTARRAADVYELSFKVLARLRELGFCKNPEKDPDPDEGEEESKEENNDTEHDDSDSTDSGRGDSPGSNDVDSAGDGGSGDSEEEEAPTKEAGDEDGEESDADSNGSDSDSGGSEGETVPEEDSGDNSEEPGELTDEGESESEPEEGGVSDQDPVPSEPGGAGESSEDSEDADDAGSSTTGPEDGDSDQEDDGPSDSSGEGSSSTGGDWSSNDYSDTEEADGDNQPDSSEEVKEYDDPDPFDMGGDEGKGGTEIHTEGEPFDYGDPEDVEAALRLIENHEEAPKTIELDAANKAVDQAIIQGVYFETPSQNIWGVRVHREDEPGLTASGKPCDNAWNHTRIKAAGIDPVQAGVECDTEVPEVILGKALLHTRRVFQENQTSKYEANLRSGRVNAKVLGRRAWSDDDRLFGKKRIPGKRDYFVLIGIDCSGSTVGENIALAKRAAMAQAELCQRTGVKFAVYAHTYNDREGLPYESDGNGVLDIYELKSVDEPWDSQRRDRLNNLGPDGGNLDGHTLEFYRKRLDEVEATDKIILYYTDGRMPASNYDEELEILQREIRTCKQKGYTLLGVGIRTDSPIRHGLDTVRVDTDDNLKDVISHLEKRLAGNR